MFQSSRAPLRHLSIVPFAENVAGQALWVSPWLWLPLVWTLARALRRGPADDRTWFFACLAAPPILLFTLVTLGGSRGLPHWQAPGYLFALPLLGRDLRRWAERAPRIVEASLLGAAVILVSVSTIAATQANTGWLSRMAPSLFSKGDPTLDAVDWTALGTSIDAANEVNLAVAPSWIQGGKVGRALNGRLPVVVLASDPHHFLYARDERAFVGRTALIVEDAASADDLGARFAPYFDRIDSLPPLAIMRRGTVAVTLRRWIGRGYRHGFPFAQPR
jgi:hypothetical protein